MVGFRKHCRGGIELIRRKLYFDNRTGRIIAHIPEQLNVKGVRETTVEEDFESLVLLKEIDKSFVGVLTLDIGEYNQDFAESNGYRVNPETQELEFSYPDPNEPEAPPVYQAPLSEVVNSNVEYLVDVDFRLSMVEMGL